MKEQTRPKPTASKLSLLRQPCNLIPNHLVPRLARETGVEDPARTFSPWSHLVGLLYAQLTHSLGRNDVCAALRLTIVQMWDNLVAEKTRRQVAQFGDGLVMHPAIRSHVHHPDGTNTAKELEPLAGRAFAKLQALDQVIHGQGAGGNEEQAVDFGQGQRLAEQPRELDEEVNDLRLQRIEPDSGWWFAGNFARWFFGEGQLHEIRYTMIFNLFNRE